MELKSVWTKLLSRFEVSNASQETLWLEIEKKYSGRNRYYHNLTHLEKMIEAFDKHKNQLERKEEVLLSIFYHDLIYNPIRKDNEKQSAEWMQKRLEQINLPKSTIENCYRQIIQTKTHQTSKNSSVEDKYLLDFDLEVLSRDWEEYKTYSEQIRKEYWMYPNPLYKKGRKSAMTTFLQRTSIYHTDVYKDEKEAVARKNIKREIEELLN